MRTQGIYINVSRRNDDLPQLIEEYSEQFNLSKADTVAEILRRAYPKLIAYKHRVLEQESSSFGRMFSKPYEKKKPPTKMRRGLREPKEELVNT